jgi:hypothetical protein
MTAVEEQRGAKVRRHLDVLEESREGIVLRERPHRGLGVVFCLCGIALLSLLVARTPRPGQTGLIALIIFVGLGFLSFGVFCLVDSTIIVSVGSGDLRIRRQIGFLKSNKRYPVEQVKRVMARTAGKGSGLSMELASGRTRNLTFFTEYADPAEQAGKLNHFIRTATKRRQRHGL